MVAPAQFALRCNHNLPIHRAAPKCRECFCHPFKWKGLVNHGFNLPVCGPFHRNFNVGPITTVAANNPLLLHEKWPKVHSHVATCCCAARHDRAAPCETLKTSLEHLCAYMFHDEIHSPFLGDF